MASRRLEFVDAGPCFGVLHGVYNKTHFMDRRTKRLFDDIGRGVTFRTLERSRVAHRFSAASFYETILYCLLNHLLQENDADERAYTEAIQERYSGEPVCDTLYIMPTLDCNLRCAYCFIRKRAARLPSGRLSPGVLRNALEFLSRASRRSMERATIIFYGGEPLLAFEAIRYVAEYVDRHGSGPRFGWSPPTVSVVTNGTLIDPEKAAFLAAHRIHVAVSVDASKRVNDLLRRSLDRASSFDRAWRGIAILERHGVPFNLSITLTRNNIAHVPAFLRYCLERTGCRHYAINLLARDGTSNDLYVGPPLDREGLDRIYDVVDETGIHEESLAKCLARLQSQRPQFRFCDAIGGQIVLLPDGTAVPCQGLAGMPGSAVRYSGGERVLQSPLFRAWAARTPWLMRDCYEKCNLFSVCGGGCAYNSFMDHGDIMKLDPAGCALSKYLIGRALARIAREGYAKARSQS